MERQEVPRVTVESSSESQDAIENLFDERRTFPPDPAFVAQANAKPDLYEVAERDFEGFWARIARERVDWTKPFEKTLEWDLPFAKWFLGGQLNIAENCVDRHVRNGLGHKVAYHWIGEPVDTSMTAGRDVGWPDIVDRQPEACTPVPVDSEQLLYLLYTSGTTAKPKGIVHTTAGYLVGTSYTHEMIFDVKPDDVYWCAADIGWVTGHSYIVYGPLANATTGVMYEGTPDTPAWDRWWQIVEDYKVTILYCAPTAIRAFMKQGEEYPTRHDLSSLRLLGSVGEPINPEAWLWYQEYIGRGRTPIVDTWWQTATGMILITQLPAVTTPSPGSPPFPFPGIEADVVDNEGRSVPLGGGGYLVLKRPWPAMLRGIYGDPG